VTALLDGTARAALASVARVQARGRLPSIAAGVVRGGELVWTAGRGTTVTATPGGLAGPVGAAGRPDPDTQYKIGSVTKTMTAALVMLARERGDLTLSDRVGRFLPGGPFSDATVRDLLSHAAGITAEPHGSWWERSPGADGAALVAAHAGAEPVLEPGSRHHYSNLGYGVLGEVVAQVCGCSWAEALAEQLLAPLGLARTSYHQQAPHADGFAVDFLTGEIVAEPLPDTGAMAPAGQLWSTVTDLAVWLTALVDPDRSVLAAESLVAMRTPQAAAPEGRDGSSYGLGLSVTVDRGRMLVGHGGSMPGFCCGVLADVDSGTGAVVLTNGAYGLGGLTREVLEVVLDREPPIAAEWTPVRSVPDDVREVVGTWYWGHAPSVLRWDGLDLLLAPADGPGRAMRFRPAGSDTWTGTAGYLTGETLRAVRRSDGTVGHLEAATFIYTRTPYDPQAPIPGGLPGT
jgi:CubicO group peptidase (beta-lactamase class C family)